MVNHVFFKEGVVDGSRVAVLEVLVGEKIGSIEICDDVREGGGWEVDRMKVKGVTIVVGVDDQETGISVRVSLKIDGSRVALMNLMKSMVTLMVEEVGVMSGIYLRNL